VFDRASAAVLAEFNPTADVLVDAFWPGPLTLVLPKKDVVPDLVTAGRPSVAVRSPAHPLLRQLLEHSHLPLAAPSANLFGSVSPTTAQHVEEKLGDRIEHILDGGPCSVGVESTIVDLRDETDPVILRQGGIPREELERVIGRSIRIHKPVPENRGPAPKAELAPGMLDRHYSPETPVELRDKMFSQEELTQAEPRTALVCFRKPDLKKLAPNIRWLSDDGDPAEAGRGLFALMRELDKKGFERIIFEPAPETGIGPAINDRLSRASAKAGNL
jgi:L-threonylcarbamoyladenylate synthase